MIHTWNRPSATSRLDCWSSAVSVPLSVFSGAGSIVSVLVGEEGADVGSAAQPSRAAVGRRAAGQREQQRRPAAPPTEPPHDPNSASISATPTAVRSSSPGSTLSSAAWMWQAGSSTPISRISASGWAAASALHSGIAPPWPAVTRSRPYAAAHAGRQRGVPAALRARRERLAQRLRLDGDLGPPRRGGLEVLARAAAGPRRRPGRAGPAGSPRRGPRAGSRRSRRPPTARRWPARWRPAAPTPCRRPSPSRAGRRRAAPGRRPRTGRRGSRRRPRCRCCRARSTVVSPASSRRVASTAISAASASGAAPPYIPECAGPGHRAHRHQHRAGAAQAGGHGRRAELDVAGVGDQHHVGGEQPGVGADQPAEAARATSPPSPRTPRARRPATASAARAARSAASPGCPCSRPRRGRRGGRRARSAPTATRPTRRGRPAARRSGSRAAPSARPRGRASGR